MRVQTSEPGERSSPLLCEFLKSVTLFQEIFFFGKNCPQIDLRDTVFVLS